MPRAANPFAKSGFTRSTPPPSSEGVIGATFVLETLTDAQRFTV